MHAQNTSGVSILDLLRNIVWNDATLAELLKDELAE